jgi:hypothetical protein
MWKKEEIPVRVAEIKDLLHKILFFEHLHEQEKQSY